MGVEFEVLGAADKKNAAKKWIVHHFSRRVKHCFSNNDAFVDGGGRYCEIHQKVCVPDQTTPDCTSAGLVCRPFSHARTKNLSGAQGPPEQHPDYDSVFTGFGEYLDVRGPLCWFVEESDAFMEVDKRHGKSHCAIFMQDCSKRGPTYSIRALCLNHDDWIDLPRNRAICLAFIPCAGGKAVAEWAVSEINAALTFRRMAPPVPLLPLLGLGSADHKRRLKQAQDLSNGP